MPRAAKPKILFLITDLNLGGSPLMLANLAGGLQSHFDVHVCSLAAIPGAADSQLPIPDSAAVVPDCLRAAGVPIHSLNLASVSAKNATAGLVAYRKLLEEINPDLVYSILIHANALATLGKQGGEKKYKLVHAIHTLQPEPRWHWQLQGAIAKTADAVIAPSQAILNRIGQYGSFERGVVIPNGIDTRHFAVSVPHTPLLKLDSTRACRLGYVGRFDPVKRLDTLILAVAELRKENLSVEVDLVGYGEQLPQLVQLATSLQVAPFVHFHSPTSDPAGWYKSFDIHVLPSPVEGFGLTLVESLAAGTPVVAIETPATLQIVRQNIDGVLVPTPDAKSLAIGIKEVMAWLMWGKAAGGTSRWNAPSSQKWVEQRFNLQSMINAHVDNLERILRD